MALQLTQLRIPNMTTDYGNVGGLAANIGNQFLGSLDAARKDAKEEAATQALIGAFDKSQGAPQTLGALGAPAAPQGAMAPAQSAMKPMSSSEYGDIFARKEAELGLPPGYLQRTAAVESSMNPNAKNPNSSAGGLFQFIDSTAKQYGLANKFDPVAATDAAARLAADNKKILASALGREPTAGELYLAHQQGAGGAAKMLANPNAPAEAVVGPEAARLNGGAGLTAGQFAQKWISKIDGGGRPVQVAQAAPDAAAPMADVPASSGSTAGFTIPGQAAGAQPAAQPATAQNTNAGIVRALLASPSTRAAGLQLWQQMSTGKSFGFQMIGDQLYRTNANTGTAELVPGITNPKATLDQRKAELDIQKAEKDISGTLTPEQEAQKIRLAQASRTQINNTNAFDAKGEGKFNEALGAAQAKRWNGYIEEGDVAQNRLADIQTLRETSRRLGSQGSSANLKALVGPYAESLGIQVEGLGDIQLYESITNRLAPTLRAPGSGSTSDIEFKGFQRAIGPLSNNPAAREMILDTFEAASRNDVARSEIASRLAAGEIDRGQAEKELRSLPNPLENFRKFREANPDLVGQAIKETGQRAALEKNGPPKITNPEQAAKLPSGTEFIDPNGIKRRVP